MQTLSLTHEDKRLFLKEPRLKYNKFKCKEEGDSEENIAHNEKTLYGLQRIEKTTTNSAM